MYIIRAASLILLKCNVSFYENFQDNPVQNWPKSWFDCRNNAGINVCVTTTTITTPTTSTIPTTSISPITSTTTTRIKCDGTHENMWSCCTSSNPCEENEGDCDKDSHCNGDLKCGKNNCLLGSNLHAFADCCYKPSTSEQLPLEILPNTVIISFLKWNKVFLHYQYENL